MACLMNKTGFFPKEMTCPPNRMSNFPRKNLLLPIGWRISREKKLPQSVGQAISMCHGFSNPTGAISRGKKLSILFLDFV